MCVPGRLVVGAVGFAAVTCVAAVVAFTALRSGNDDLPAAPSLWSVAHAESRTQTAPPRVWVNRRWNVDYVACDGLGRARLDGSRRLYRRFSCEITVVRPSGDCASSGVYFCVAGFESTALLRTVRVLDGTRYVLDPAPG
jgi:hypothetical protein